MNHPRLSVNIIVKNAEKSIDSCLKSVCDLADEIIVVDTGSIDNTLDKLKEYNIKLFQIDWDDDFSAARNVAINHSTGDWILYIDADEILHADRKTIEEMMRGNAEGYWLTVNSYTSSDMSQSTTHRNLRMFRNCLNYRFEGRIHEQILSSILKEHTITDIKETNVTISHFGYLPDQVKEQNKIERNIYLLELSLNEDPNQPFHLYNLGVEYSRLQNYEQSILYLKKCLQYEQQQASYLPSVYFLLGKNLYNCRQFQEAEQILQKAINLYPDFTDLHYLLAQLYSTQALYEKALNHLYKTIELGDAPKKYISNAGAGSFLSHVKIGEIYEDLKYKEEALQRYFQAIKINPHAKIGYLKFYSLLAKVEMTDHSYQNYIHEIDQIPDVRKDLIALGLYRTGYYDQALQYIRQLDSEDDEILYVKNECLMQTGQCIDAIRLQKKVLHQFPSDHPDKDEWLLLHVFCFWSEQIPLPYSIQKQMEKSESLGFVFQLNTLLEEGKEIDKAYLSVDTFTDLLKRLLYFGFIEVAETILTKIGSLPKYELAYSKLIYKEGYTMRAAERFLFLMEQNELDNEAIYYLAEILFDRQQYHHAISLFELVLRSDADHFKAKTGAILSYLAEGYEWLSESKRDFPASNLLSQQLEEIDKSIKHLQNVDWHTKWNFRQRRNKNR